MGVRRGIVIVGWLLLIFQVAAMFLFAIWWILPLLFLLAARALLWLWGKERLRGFAKAGAFFLLLGVATWAYFWPRNENQPPPRSYLDSVPRFLLKRQVAASESVDSAKISATRQFLAQSAEVRLELARVQSARTYLNDARAWWNFLTDDKSASSDATQPGKLSKIKSDGETLDKAITALRPPNAHSLTADDNLLLQQRVAEGTKLLNERIKEVKDGGLSAEQIILKTNELADVLGANSLQDIWNDQKELQLAVQDAGQTGINTPQSSYSELYDRGTDSLSAVHTIQIDLLDREPTKIDVSNLFVDFTDPSLTQQITVREDSVQGPPAVVPQASPVHDVSASSRHITITNTVTQTKASYPIVYKPFPSLFKAINAGWPLPTSSSVQVTVRIPKNPGLVFPVRLAIFPPSGAQIKAIFVPHNSFFYSPVADLTQAINTQPYDQVAPNTKAPSVSEMYGGSSIHIELLPWYLSYPWGQEHKQYLVFENLWYALSLAGASALALGFLEWAKGPSAAPDQTKRK